MDLSITGQRSILLTVDGGPLAITVNSDDDEVDFSPLHMLAGSLATCTAAVLGSYAETARLAINGATIAIEWDYSDDPRRVGAYRVTIGWPEALPEGRRKALLRAAEHCTVHATLQHPPQIDLAVAE